MLTKRALEDVSHVGGQLGEAMDVIQVENLEFSWFPGSIFERFCVLFCACAAARREELLKQAKDG